MGYIKLSNNKYKITIELGYDILGKRRRKTEMFIGTLPEVKIREAELIKEHYKKGYVANVKEITFEQYSDVFLKRYCQNNIALVTIANYERLLKRVLYLIGKVKLSKVTPLMLDKMYNSLRIGEKKQTLSYNSMYDYYKLINVMFNQAIKWELIDNNPNLKAKKPKKEKVERKFYDLEQVNKFFACLVNENIKYRALLTLAIDSGARRGEIVALKWQDINFETNAIKIDNSLKVVNGVIDEKNAKTNASNREIILSNATMKVLKAYKEWQDNSIKAMGSKWKGTNRVFTSENGKHMHPSTCLKMLNKVTTKYNMPHLTFHELRHTSISILVQNGINPKAVSQRAGHSTTAVTMEIYTHVHDKSKKDSAIAFDKIINMV